MDTSSSLLGMPFMAASELPVYKLKEVPGSVPEKKGNTTPAVVQAAVSSRSKKKRSKVARPATSSSPYMPGTSRTSFRSTGLVALQCAAGVREKVWQKCQLPVQAAFRMRAASFVPASCCRCTSASSTLAWNTVLCTHMIKLALLPSAVVALL